MPRILKNNGLTIVLMLLFAARRMLVELCGYLSATSTGAQRISFSFEHHKREPTRITLSLVAASRDADHLTNVLRERLARTARRRCDRRAHAQGSSSEYRVSD